MTVVGSADALERRLGWRSLVCALALILAVIGLGIWVRLYGRGVTELDQWWLGEARVDPDSALFVLAQALHAVGSAVGVIVCMVLCTAFFLGVRRWRDAAALVTGGVLGVLASETLKVLLARARPEDALVIERSFSYPSGHSMGAAVLGTSLALVVILSARRTTLGSGLAAGLAITWAALMMWSRTALHAHWLTDTLGGAALGVAMAILARLIWQPARPGDARLTTVVPESRPQPH